MVEALSVLRKELEAQETGKPPEGAAAKAARGAADPAIADRAAAARGAGAAATRARRSRWPNARTGRS